MMRLAGRDVCRVGILSYYLAFEVNGGPRPPGKTIESIAYWEHLKRHLNAARIDLAIDVGANEGDFAAGLRRLGYRGRVASFEPIPEVAARLAERAKGDPLWSVHPFALGDVAGDEVLHVGTVSTFASLHTPSEFGSRQFKTAIGSAREIHVRVRRLDDVLAGELSHAAAGRLFLKLDTQGFDINVFRGAGAFERRVALLQAELTFQPLYDHVPEFLESCEFFRGRGFRPTGFFPVCEDPANGSLVEVDCLMVRHVDPEADAIEAPVAEPARGQDLRS
jgi:FkbM family methyltransferase